VVVDNAMAVLVIPHNEQSALDGELVGGEASRRLSLATTDPRDMIQRECTSTGVGGQGVTQNRKSRAPSDVGDSSVHPQFNGAGISYHQSLLEDFEIIRARELCSVDKHKCCAGLQFQKSS